MVRFFIIVGDYFLPGTHENTKFNITVECQKIHAIKTNDDWDYSACIEELTKSANTIIKIPLI